MIAAQLNALCAAYQNVDKMTLHTGNPGTAGTANNSGIAAGTITWGTPTNGVMIGTVSWTDISGDFTHVGLWDGSVFIESKPRVITLGSATDLSIAVEHKVDER